MTEQPLFAGVCLLDNPFAIDGVYDYRIPLELADEVRPGAFVSVPFGTANHLRLALVREVRATSDYAEHKAIREVCPDRLSLNEEMRGLCDFMKLRTLCSTGDAVRAMIPASALSRLITLFCADPAFSAVALEERPPLEQLVYRYLVENGETASAFLRDRFGAGVEVALRRLCACGAISKRVLLKDADAECCEKRWLAALPPQHLQSLIAGEPFGRSKLTDKQRAVLSAIVESDEPLNTVELKAASGVTDSPLKTLLSKGILRVEERRIDRNPYADAPFVGQTPLSLNEEQTEAVRILSSLFESDGAKAALLHGVTGSGKTVVMTALIDKILARGKSVILLLPEIALTPQSVSIFCARYGERVAVIHSALSAGERYDAYCRIREGGASLVIGTRSAVFAPLSNLGAIIIDEEQEHTYKSDQNPKYHARDIARFRCAHHKALMLLASATPSLESYHKAVEGVYTLVTLTQRFGGAALPRVKIADMRQETPGGNTSPLGETLMRALVERGEKQEQSVLFLNRRGYNHFVSCRGCGEAVSCPNCSVAMTYHTRRGTYAEGDLVCHWCGHRVAMPKECPTCHSPHLVRMGFGTQRVEEELKKLLPDARVLRMDTDTTASKFSYDSMLGDFRAHKADVLLGTQMVTKGHDFPDVTLVGVLLADASLYLDDYRASERTFSMLTQVIGRAGRGERAGVAIIQTNNPDHEIIRLSCAQDYKTFYEREIKLRRLLVFPPFCDIALLTLSGVVENDVLKATGVLHQMLLEGLKNEYKDVETVCFGPFEAPVYRVDNKYRMRMVIKCRLNRRTLSMLSELVCRFYQKVGRKVSLSADLNPNSL